jgi:hypothetical protein
MSDSARPSRRGHQTQALAQHRKKKVLDGTKQRIDFSQPKQRSHQSAGAGGFKSQAIF